MKHQLSTKVAVTTAITIISLVMFSQPSHGRPSSPTQGESRFWCSTSTGMPVTVYQNPQGAIEPWIEWNSDYFSGSGYNRETRCQLVSQRLETYRRSRQLKYITVGVMNSQNVICTAHQINGVCQNLIYTLKPGQDPIGSLYNLLAWRQGQVGMPSLGESMAIPYIDVTEKLGQNNDDIAQQPPFFQSSTLP